ncbi:MAG: class C sortase, partial [Oscillospiraceae bacterium]|nr:class C sortase [Oscillospiraceae bacterium]
MLRKLNIMLFALVFLVGLGLLLYPIVNGAIIDDAIQNNADAFINNDSTGNRTEQPENNRPYAALWEAMQNYNEGLLNTQRELLRSVDDYIKPSFVLTEYGLEDNIFGVIAIPKLEVNLPIYLGASDQNMANGAVHLSQTSLPIGGKSTNAVIAAHRGWNGASYFLNIHKLAAGDTVTVTNLWETLTYEVTEIKLIAPN